jgi:hypothetical protein
MLQFQDCRPLLTELQLGRIPFNYSPVPPDGGPAEIKDRRGEGMVLNNMGRADVQPWLR